MGRERGGRNKNCKNDFSAQLLPKIRSFFRVLYHQDLGRITISSRGVNDSYAQAFGRSPLQMVYNLTFCVSPDRVRTGQL
ncbi:MAG: hypothetical protein F6K17_28260 [Okeania sp. SIO3C4]|nr:hypothetical protein [Okeania sp. SIO3C4]